MTAVINCGSTDIHFKCSDVEFRFEAVVLTEKLAFDKTYENIGFSWFHCYPFFFFVIVVPE